MFGTVIISIPGCPGIDLDSYWSAFRVTTAGCENSLCICKHYVLYAKVYIILCKLCYKWSVFQSFSHVSLL